MIPDTIKNLFSKKYFVFDDLKIEINRDIAYSFQSSFDQLICVAKLLGYMVKKEKSPLSVDISFCKDRNFVFNIKIYYYKNKVSGIIVGFPIYLSLRFFYENKPQYESLYHRYKCNSDEIINALNLTNKMLLDI
jgi:hypothetical protein